MKIISLSLSSLVFGIATYYFITDFRDSVEFNYIIYMSMLVILMSICVVGIMINLPYLIHGRKNIFFVSKKLKKKHHKKERALRLKKHNYVSGQSADNLV